jgi:hypothetical protein
MIRPVRSLVVVACWTGCGFSSQVGTDAPPSLTVDAAPDTSVPHVCGPDYDDEIFDGHSYRLVAMGLTWAAAQANCAVDGGHLLKIESAAENQRAEELLVGLFHVWIGLRDVQANDTYRWVDDTPLQGFANWGNANGSLDCVGLYAENGQWNTRDCSSNEWVVCECDGLPP